MLHKNTMQLFLLVCSTIGFILFVVLILIKQKLVMPIENLDYFFTILYSITTPWLFYLVNAKLKPNKTGGT